VFADNLWNAVSVDDSVVPGRNSQFGLVPGWGNVAVWTMKNDESPMCAMKVP
jgi:hypothetical protein